MVLEVYTLFQKEDQKEFFADATENPFWCPKEYFSGWFLKEPYLLCEVCVYASLNSKYKINIVMLLYWSLLLLYTSNKIQF